MAAEAFTPPPSSSSSATHHQPQNLKNNKNWFVVDFDGTCSIDDTTPMLPRLAGLLYNKQQRQKQQQETSNDDDELLLDEDNKIVQERLKIFSELEQEYFNLYKEAKDQNNNNDGISAGSLSLLHEALDRLDDVSNRVTQKVSSSGVLKGLLANLEYTNEMKQLLLEQNDDSSLQVRIRPYCGSVLSKILYADNGNNDNATGNKNNKHWNLAVLSINWCPSLIAASLQPHINMGCRSFQDTIPIWSNNVHTETGIVSLQIPGALSKRQKIKQLKQQQQQQQQKEDSTTTGLVVYIGDSATDLAALIEADVGILMCGSESTINMVKQYGGVIVKPLTEWHRHQHQHSTTTLSDQTTTTYNTSKNSCIIWTTECWSEVDKILKISGGDDGSTWFR